VPLPQLKVLQPNAKQGTRRRYSSVSGPERTVSVAILNNPESPHDVDNYPPHTKAYR
jgi:hypothetical protein